VVLEEYKQPRRAPVCSKELGLKVGRGRGDRRETCSVALSEEGRHELTSLRGRILTHITLGPSLCTEHCTICG
jgi:hypothetical protein